MKYLPNFRQAEVVGYCMYVRLNDVPKSGHGLIFFVGLAGCLYNSRKNLI